MGRKGYPAEFRRREVALDGAVGHLGPAAVAPAKADHTGAHRALTGTAQIRSPSGIVSAPV